MTQCELKRIFLLTTELPTLLFAPYGLPKTPTISVGSIDMVETQSRFSEGHFFEVLKTRARESEPESACGYGEE